MRHNRAICARQYGGRLHSYLCALAAAAAVNELDCVVCKLTYGL